jgi:hypothetical protein
VDGVTSSVYAFPMKEYKESSSILLGDPAAFGLDLMSTSLPILRHEYTCTVPANTRADTVKGLF